MALHSAPVESDSDIAVMDLIFWRPGLWHLHGTHQRFVTPHRRQRDAMLAAVQCACERHCREIVFRLHNRWGG